MDAKTLEKLNSINETLVSIEKTTQDSKSCTIKEKASKYLGTDYPHILTNIEEKQIRAKYKKIKTSKKKASRAEAAKITKEIIGNINNK